MFVRVLLVLLGLLSRSLKQHLSEAQIFTKTKRLPGAIERLKEAAAQADEKEKSHGACDENCFSTARLASNEHPANQGFQDRLKKV